MKKNFWKAACRHLIVVLLCAVSVVSLFSIYFSLLNKNVSEETKNTLLEISAQNATAMEKQISGDFNVLSTLSTYIGQEEVFDVDKIAAALKKEVKNSAFKKMGIITPAGISHATDEVNVDVSDRDYFKESMEGKSVFSEILTDKVDGEKINVYTTPIYKKDRIVGVLFAMNRSKVYTDILSKPIFRGQGCLYITKTDGTIIFGPDKDAPLKPRLIYDLFNRSEAAGAEALQTMKREMSAWKTGTVEYKKHPPETYLSYTPLRFNNWYLVSVVPAGIIQSRTKEIEFLSVYLTACVIAVVLSLILFLALFQIKNRRAIMANEMKLRTITENIPGGVQQCKNDPYFTITYLSDGFLDIVGYTRKEIEALFDNKLVNMVHKDEASSVFSSISKQLKDSGQAKFEFRISKKDGGYAWVLDSCTLVKDSKNDEYVYCMLVDITESKTIQQEQFLNNERYRIVAEQSDSIIYEHNLDSQIIFFTSNFKRKLGYEPENTNFPQSHIENHTIYKDDVGAFLELYNNIKNGASYAKAEIRIRNAEGQYIWFSIKGTAIQDNSGKPVKIIGKMSDIHAEKQQTERLKLMSQKDPLTGLYNKVAAEKLIDHFLEDEGRNDKHAMLAIDVDDFKGINDTFGHLFGDRVLKKITEELNKISRSTDIFVRFGGDEFIAFFKSIPSENLAIEKANEILNSLKISFAEENKKHTISSSVGISYYPKDGKNFRALYEKADKALYIAKSKGKDCYAVCSE